MYPCYVNDDLWVPGHFHDVVVDVCPKVAKGAGVDLQGELTDREYRLTILRSQNQHTHVLDYQQRVDRTSRTCCYVGRR